MSRSRARFALAMGEVVHRSGAACSLAELFLPLFRPRLGQEQVADVLVFSAVVSLTYFALAAR